MIVSVLSLAFLRLGDSGVCTQKLGIFLSSLQDRIAQGFLRSYMAHQTFGAKDVDALLHSSIFPSKGNCKLVVSDQKIQVQSGNLQTIFEIQYVSENAAPKIICPFSNPLCKKLNSRILAK